MKLYESRRLFTADPFDTEYTYFCTKTNKVIAEYIGPFDKMPDIPDSCPIKAD